MTCCPSKSMLLPCVLLLGAGALAFGASSFGSATAQDPKPPAEKPKEGETPKDGEKPKEGQRPGGRGQGDGGGAPDLESSMESMNAAIRALDKELKAKDPNAWKSISQFERGVASAKLEEPPAIKKMPEAQRAAAVAEYRNMMADLLQAGCKLEHEVLASKWEEASKTLEDSIKPAKKKGHAKFNPDSGKKRN